VARDDFSKETIAVLARRVAHRCSNPKCRVITTGPHTNAAKAINVGVAAHVTAASLGGPRHDPAMSTEQRKDATNGIWLCQTCSKLIDSDLDKYTKDLLLEWKSVAEEAASIELATGAPPPIDQSTIQFAVDNWNIWRRGDLQGVVSQWVTGDIRYSFNIRLRNTSQHEEQLHNLRIQYRNQTDIVFEDTYAVQGEIALPRQQWKTIGVDYGVHQGEVNAFNASDSLWFAADLVGSTKTFAWSIAALDHSKPIETPKQ
jgi:hypothetical protein